MRSSRPGLAVSGFRCGADRSVATDVTTGSPGPFSLDMEVVRVDREPEIASSQEESRPTLTLALEPSCVDGTCDLEEVITIRLTRTDGGESEVELAVLAVGEVIFASEEDIGENQLLEVGFDPEPPPAE